MQSNSVIRANAGCSEVLVITDEGRSRRRDWRIRMIGIRLGPERSGLLIDRKLERWIPRVMIIGPKVIDYLPQNIVR